MRKIYAVSDSVAQRDLFHTKAQALEVYRNLLVHGAEVGIEDLDPIEEIHQLEAQRDLYHDALMSILGELVEYAHRDGVTMRCFQRANKALGDVYHVPGPGDHGRKRQPPTRAEYEELRAECEELKAELYARGYLAL